MFPVILALCFVLKINFVRCVNINQKWNMTKFEGQRRGKPCQMSPIKF